MGKHDEEGQAVFALTDGHCAYCGASLAFWGEWHLEHVVPRSREGKWKGNLVPACTRCNFRKGVLLPSEFRRWIPCGLRKQIEHMLPAVESLCELLSATDAEAVLTHLEDALCRMENTTVTFYSDDLLREIEDKFFHGG